jgi:hypothetical protein
MEKPTSESVSADSRPSDYWSERQPLSVSANLFHFTVGYPLADSSAFRVRMKVMSEHLYRKQVVKDETIDPNAVSPPGTPTPPTPRRSGATGTATTSSISVWKPPTWSPPQSELDAWLRDHLRAGMELRTRLRGSPVSVMRPLRDYRWVMSGHGEVVVWINQLKDKIAVDLPDVIERFETEDDDRVLVLLGEGRLSPRQDVMELLSFYIDELTVLLRERTAHE